MKLARIGNPSKEKPIIVDKDNNYRDVSSVIKDFNSENLNFKTIDKLKNIKIEDLPTLDKNQRIGACVHKPSKFIGIGLNFKDHAIEQNLSLIHI